MDRDKEKIAGEKRISRLTLGNVVFRTLFFQSVFTLQDKLGGGFGFAALPGLKQLARDGDHLRELLARHTAYFNAHPYLASFVVGAVLKIESSTQASGEQRMREIDHVKNRLGGMLGSLGDRLFWKYLKPAVSATALSFILLLNDYFPMNIYVGAALFLLLFNAVHLYYRIHGVYSGFAAGVQVIRKRSITGIERLNYRLLCYTFFCMGFLLVLMSDRVMTPASFGIVVFAAALLMSFYFNHKKASPWLSIAAGLASSVVLFILYSMMTG